MNLCELISIKTDEENNSKHTRYNEELKLFSCIQQGDINKLIDEMKKLNTSVTTGKLSNDSITQYRYLAVSTITLATSYAIQGGLNEKEAYDFSDSLARIFRRFKHRHIVVTSAGEVIGKTAVKGFLRIGGKAHTADAVA